MSLYAVVAVSVDPNYPNTFSEARTEEIDTETNYLFGDCRNPWEVEDEYHKFWNRLNPSWETAFPENKEKVLVISVTKLG
jgi:hypothetical protein